MKAVLSTMCAAAILCGGSQMAVQAQSSAHVISALQEAQWVPAPPLIPTGAQIAVLAGNPMGTGAYTIRIKMPANYAIPAHSHPTDENVVVVSGELTFGMGDKLTTDSGSNKTLSPGGYALMPANMNHFAYTTTAETTIVLYGQGPVEFKYVNPADDPRNQSKGTK